MIKLKLMAILALLFVIHTNAQENVAWKFKTANRIYSSPIINESYIYFGVIFLNSSFSSSVILPLQSVLV